MFKKSKINKLKRKIDGKINLYLCCVGCSFKKLLTLNEGEINVLFEKG